MATGKSLERVGVAAGAEAGVWAVVGVVAAAGAVVTERSEEKEEGAKGEGRGKASEGGRGWAEG